MCPGWFDNLPQEDDAEDAISGVDSGNASKESTEDKTDANEEKDASSSKNSSKKSPALSSQLSRGLVIGAVLVLVLGGAYFVVKKSSNADAVAAQPTSSIAPKPTSTTTTTTSTVVERCPGQPKASTKTPQGAFIAFQQAYFAGDTKALSKTVESSSYLANVDWPTLAKDVIGSEFCVKITDVTDGVIDASTTVRTPKGEELLFIQLVHTIKEGNNYKISSIEDKPVSDNTDA